jgi:predicted RND superfamily exporter protein
MSTYSDDIRSVVDRENGQYRTLLVRVFVNARGTEDTRLMASQMQENIQGTPLVLAGDDFIFIKTVDSLQSNQIKTTMVSLLFAGLLVVAIYGSVRLGMIVLAPVIFSSVIILGTIAVLAGAHGVFGLLPDISLNVLTISVTALTVGLGVDYSIHITDRYLLEAKTKNPQEALESTLRSTGSALTISAVTTMVGFSVLVMSPIPAIAQFGLATAITIAYAFLFSILFLPVLLLMHSELEGR